MAHTREIKVRMVSNMAGMNITLNIYLFRVFDTVVYCN